MFHCFILFDSHISSIQRRKTNISTEKSLLPNSEDLQGLAGLAFFSSFGEKNEVNDTLQVGYVSSLMGTVDGRNHAPVDMVNIPWFTRFHACWVVQDFFHQQYTPGKWAQLLHLFFFKAPIIGNGKKNIASGTKAQISGEPCQFFGGSRW